MRHVHRTTRVREGDDDHVGPNTEIAVIRGDGDDDDDGGVLPPLRKQTTIKILRSVATGGINNLRFKLRHLQINIPSLNARPLIAQNTTSKSDFKEVL